MTQVPIFIYIKDGIVKALAFEDAKRIHDSLIAQNWKHTTTIDVCRWIEYLCNESDNLENDILSLKQ